MKLGPSLIGAVVGSAVGVAAQVLFESTAKVEAAWFAVVIGVLTGFGARVLAGDSINTASYIRAGLVAIIAFGSILGGTYASSVVATRSSMEAIKAPPPIDVNTLINESQEPAEEEAPATEDDDGAAEDDTAEEQPVEEEAAEEQPADEEEPAEGESSEEDSTDEETSEDEPAAELPGVDPADREPASQSSPVDLSAIEKMGQMSDQSELKAQDLPIWSVVLIAVGTFLAYEISRGSTKSE